MNKESQQYLEWFASHKKDCKKNHEGSAGAMEPAAMREIFKESVDKLSVRYTVYIRDGDSSTLKNFLDDKPYGDDLEVKKRECVGHFQKHMGTRHRNFKKRNMPWYTVV